MAAPDARTPSPVARALVRLNAHVLGVVLGLLAGSALLVATLVLVVQGGPQTGQMLGLLAHFFPGYAVSVGGAFVGGAWGAVVGYAIGHLLGRAFGPWFLSGAARMVERRAAGELGERHTIRSLRPLAFATVSAGLAAAGLILATSWLWWRYGGHESPHLALLGHYLPGYSTDPLGAFVGAPALFAYVFTAAFGVAWLYGVVARVRNP
jgi:ascorbate-specific PTS system EIIC-type component UlaA